MYLAFDCETGGIDPREHSLLTAHFLVLEDNLNIIDELGLKIKHSTYHLQGQALEINKINITSHERSAIDVPTARLRLIEFTRIYHGLTPVGHNVDFDISFVETVFQPFRQTISHRKIDTATIGRFLQMAGRLPEIHGLPAYCEYFAIPLDAHDARADIVATVALLKRFIAITRIIQ